MNKSAEVLVALQRWYSEDTRQERLQAFSWLGGVIQVTEPLSREWYYYNSLQDYILNTKRAQFFESAIRSLPFGGSAMIPKEAAKEKEESYW